MDVVTLIGLIAVAVMFCTGVGLVWIGLRRRPDRMPLGADDVLAAVAEGRLNGPARASRAPTRAPAARTEPARVTPTPAPSRTPTPGPDVEPMPLAVATAAPATPPRARRAARGVDLVRPPAAPPRAAQPTPAVRILARDEVPVRPEPTPEPAPAAPAPVATAALPADAPADLASEAPVLDETRPISTAELNDALFAGIDDPSHDGQGFFADKPQLQRF